LGGENSSFLIFKKKSHNQQTFLRELFGNILKKKPNRHIFRRKKVYGIAIKNFGGFGVNFFLLSSFENRYI
jgi:hypothetical protein